MEQIVPYIISSCGVAVSGLIALVVKILWQIMASVSEINKNIAVIKTEIAHGSERAERNEAAIESIFERVLRLETTH